eukprot:TRINITY_DN19529_c0_g1_i1.p1 TRINITY_DN19529_c0_g1~~TRINITY_DN19529_c0_g1_i1.p1  ORF type:complete len:543 (-),score=136.07 TRINITY_DN19529_c0_g1_i1:750-2378(-)
MGASRAPTLGFCRALKAFYSRGAPRSLSEFNETSRGVLTAAAASGGGALASSDDSEDPPSPPPPLSPPAPPNVSASSSAATNQPLGGSDLTPAKVVEALDRFIVGQAEAKRAVAVALRNRWRRHKIPSPMREEIVPKNILMIGPTGCGKTEIARRLAKLADAPFVKVEATKFTEVGFHGRDVDQIIRDLVDNAISLQRQKVRARVAQQVEQAVEARLLELLAGQPAAPAQGESTVVDAQGRQMAATLRALLRLGKLEERRVPLDPAFLQQQQQHEAGTRLNGLRGSNDPIIEMLARMEKLMKGAAAARGERREVTVGEARGLLTEMEMEKHLASEQIVKEAVQLAESDGIVFIDEIDKIVSSTETRHGADASSEGVQRDLLPIIEGSTVSTKHGNVATDHVLFICSGAFHACKPSDMLAELQGRLPIRVELKGLSQKDLYRILTEPECNMIRQQQLLMQTEEIDLVFTDEAIHELAAVAAEVNRSLHNIGARRLHTVLERVVEDVSFHAPERRGRQWKIDAQDVKNAVGDLLQKTDLSKYIL